MHSQNVLTEQIAARFLEGVNVDLNNFSSIADGAAECLSDCKGRVEFSGSMNLSDASAKRLIKYLQSLAASGIVKLNEEDFAHASICRRRCSLQLNGLVNLTDSVAKSLGKYRGDRLCLDGLAAISDGAVASLSQYRGELTLNGLTMLSDSAASLLCKHRGLLKLNGLARISDAAAEQLSQHGGWLELNGLTGISDASAASLSTHPGGLSLSGLKCISDSVAECLSRHRGWLELDGLAILSESVAECLSSHKGCSLSLNGISTLTDAAANSMGKYRGGLNGIDLSSEASKSPIEHGTELQLNGLNGLTEMAAEGLSAHRGRLALNGLTSLPDSAVELLRFHKGSLELNGLAVLSDKASESLSKYQGALELNGLQILSDTAAEVLSKHDSPLFLNSLTTLSDVAAKSLSMHGNNEENVSLHLNGLISVSDTVADYLSGYRGELSLNGLAALSKVAARSFSKHSDSLYLSGLKTLPHAHSRSLWKNYLYWIWFNVLTSLEDHEAARRATHHRGPLFLNGLTILSDSGAEGLTDLTTSSLSQYHNQLHLNGLTQLSDSAAKSLSKHRGGLLLNGITELSDTAARNLSRHRGWLQLDSILSLTDLAAKSLGRHRGALKLNGLKTLSDSAAKSLSRLRGDLELYSLTCLSDLAAKSLGMHRGRLKLSSLTILSVEASRCLIKNSDAESKVDRPASPSLELHAAQESQQHIVSSIANKEDFMYERVTGRYQKVMQFANQEAQRFNHEYIGTEHILLGVVKEGSGVAANVLKNLEVDLRKIRLEVEKLVQSGPEMGTVGKLPQTPRAKKVIEYSMEEARNLKHSYVGTEHILLGLLREQEGVAAQVLMNLCLKLEEVRDEIISVLSSSDDLNASGRLDLLDQGNRPVPGAGFQGTERSRTIDLFCTDLTALAYQGKLRRTAGRWPVIDELLQTLCRVGCNNAMLLGGHGIGKTAIVERFAQLIIAGNVPEIFLSKRVFAFDISKMVAFEKDKNQLKEQIDSVIKALRSNKEAILFIEDLSKVFFSDEEYGLYTAAHLQAALVDTEIQCIVTSTMEDYIRLESKNASLVRCFQKITVAPTDTQETIDIIKELRKQYEGHHNVQLTNDAITAAVELSERFVAGRHLPEKAIDVIDEACSLVRVRAISQHMTALSEIDDQVEKLNIYKEEALANQDFEKAFILRDQAEELRRMKDQITRLTGGVVDEEMVVDEEVIAEVVSKITGSPLPRLSFKESMRLMKLEEKLNNRVVGQSQAISDVVRSIRRNSYGFSDHKGLRACLLFSGPIGVGKTLLAKALADCICETQEAFIHIGMGGFNEKHSVSQLVGHIPGYTDSAEPDCLAERVRRCPNSVILLDDIEKAHPDVFYALLQVLEEGQLIDSNGRTVNFRNSIIVFSTTIDNIWPPAFSRFEPEREDSESLKEKALLSLGNAIPRVVLDRMDDTILFLPLDDNSLRRILDFELLKLQNRMRENGYFLELTDAAKEFLFSKRELRFGGARPMRRIVEQYLGDRIAEQVLDGSRQGYPTVAVDIYTDSEGRTIGLKVC